jgi:3-dehydroquinate dehydratase / shikimate dehydrogenase
MIKTKRLILRPWDENDFAPFAKLNADPRVREFFPSLLTREESDESAIKFQKHIKEHGWGLWAVSVPGFSDFIGFIGLHPVSFEAHFTPAVEIGWRLSQEAWGKGYATEGALAALDYGFDKAHLKEIVSFASHLNIRSIKVMEKIGMTHQSEDDFEHPSLPSGHPLSKHVLYRLQREKFLEKR